MPWDRPSLTLQVSRSNPRYWVVLPSFYRSVSIQKDLRDPLGPVLCLLHDSKKAKSEVLGISWDKAMHSCCKPLFLVAKIFPFFRKRKTIVFNPLSPLSSPLMPPKPHKYATYFLSFWIRGCSTGWKKGRGGGEERNLANVEKSKK